MTRVRYGLALAAVSCICALAPASAFSLDWPLGRYDSACTGFTPETISTPLTLSWEYNTSRAGKNTSSPIVVGDTVYFCAGDRVMALDAESGKLKWTYPADRSLSGTVKASPAFSEGALFFGATDGSLYAVNAANGVLMWTYPTGGAIRSSPMVSEGVVYFGSDDNSLYAVRAATGESAWRGPFATKEDIAAPPAVSSGYVVFACSDGLVYMAGASGGGQRWEHRLPMAPSRSGPVVSADVVHIAAGNTLYAIGRKTGLLRWSQPFKSDISAGPAIAQRSVSAEAGGNASRSAIFLTTRNNKLYALTSLGKLMWKDPATLPYNAGVAPTIAGGTVIVGTDRGYICAYSVEDGNLVWQQNVLPAQFKGPGDYTAVSAAPVVANNRIYVVTDDGSLHCFDYNMPDDSAPEAFNLAPAKAAAMSGSPPIRISAVVYDLGCGVNPSTIELALDGSTVTHTYDVVNSTVSYETSESSTPKILPDGRHQLALRAKDWRGNAMNVEWSFIVDNKLRPPTPPRKPTPAQKPSRPSSRPAPPPPTYGPGGPGGGSYGESPPPPPPPPGPMPGGGHGGAPPPPAEVEAPPGT
ncbi:MAG: PQQ-binding-like beta-propeller repeat protein [Armatimonadota bacterium]|nr:PQQ-binding-like beta-propeller repeat protein [Armatimonadota bacterium]